MQLGIILTSLQENLHVASLLGFTSPLDWEIEATPSDSSNALSPTHDTHLAEVLMKTLLRNLGYHTVRQILLSVSGLTFHSKHRILSRFLYSTPNAPQREGMFEFESIDVSNNFRQPCF